MRRRNRSETHFHIHWSETDRFDWKSFASSDDAKGSALGLVLPGESFSIEEFSSNCRVCKSKPVKRTRTGKRFSAPRLRQGAR
jgi:hypothetical protein